LHDAGVAILCMPCRLVGGYFVPSADLVLADLTGTEGPHPIYQLAAWARRPDVSAALAKQGASRLLVVFDDLAVARSWMLPPDPPNLAELWPTMVRDARTSLTDVGIPVEVTRFSDLLDRHQARSVFERTVREQVGRLTDTLAGPDSAAKRLMERELVRRRRFATSHRGSAGIGIRERAAAQLGNYAAQGELMNWWSPAAYCAWTPDEVELMRLGDPGFEPLNGFYGETRHAVGALAVIPDSHRELRETLALYVADLPRTPGAIVAGMADDVLGALGKLLTPGLSWAGVRELAALNKVLDGGQANRDRARRLLAAAADRGLPRWRQEETCKKLFCQLVSRYPDEVLADERDRHQAVIAALAARAPSSGEVALALTGSLTTAPGGCWHPYLSDIDVLPLRQRIPDADACARLDALYQGTPRPDWLYLNTGARAGVAGLTRDPRATLFVADQLAGLSAHEWWLLGRLVRPMRFVGGSRKVFDAFQASYLAERTCRQAAAK
jgi:hypothetical protein